MSDKIKGNVLDANLSDLTERKLTDLTDTPSSVTGQDGKALVVSGEAFVLQEVSDGGGGSASSSPVGTGEDGVISSGGDKKDNGRIDDTYSVSPTESSVFYDKKIDVHNYVDNGNYKFMIMNVMPSGANRFSNKNINNFLLRTADFKTFDSFLLDYDIKDAVVFTHPDTNHVFISYSRFGTQNKLLVSFDDGVTFEDTEATSIQDHTHVVGVPKEYSSGSKLRNFYFYERGAGNVYRTGDGTNTEYQQSWSWSTVSGIINVSGISIVNSRIVMLGYDKIVTYPLNGTGTPSIAWAEGGGGEVLTSNIYDARKTCFYNESLGASGLWVLICDDDTAGSICIFTSSNGTSFSKSHEIASASAYGYEYIASLNRLLISSDSDIYTIDTSDTDPSNWTSGTISHDGSGYDVETCKDIVEIGGDIFIALTNTSVNIPYPYTNNGLTYGSSPYSSYITTEVSQIFKSTNGTSFSLIDVNFNESLKLFKDGNTLLIYEERPTRMGNPTKFSYTEDNGITFVPISMNGPTDTKNVISESMTYIGIENDMKKMTILESIPVGGLTNSLNPVYALKLDEFINKYYKYYKNGSSNGSGYLIKVNTTFMMHRANNSTPLDYIRTLESYYRVDIYTSGAGTITPIGTPVSNVAVDSMTSASSAISTIPTANYNTDLLVFQLQADSAQAANCGGGLKIEIEILEVKSS